MTTVHNNDSLLEDADERVVKAWVTLWIPCSSLCISLRRWAMLRVMFGA